MDKYRYRKWSSNIEILSRLLVYQVSLLEEKITRDALNVSSYHNLPTDTDKDRPLEMESSDVRKRYNLASEEPRIVASVLDTGPPFWNQNKLTSGMDCLLVVLRRIYSHNMLSESILEVLHWLVEAEENNPILLHTWNVFGRLRGAAEKATAARVKVEEAIRLLGLDPRRSLEYLCFLSLMN
ncbi:hypothetical protein H9Q69_003732 [Fusarium xylarioides]|nr:hypothetical protein H9Q69_003732 [Fusarium xylarioides]